VLTGIVDGAYLDAKIILEADGRTWHARQQAFRRDRQRDNEAARVGWQTLRFPWEEVVHDPEDTAATVRDVRAQRLSRS
jgi:very-short-patch-repair endonuclease